MTLIYILGGLFVALIILVPLLEKFGPRVSSAEAGKITRYLYPLMALIIIVQLLLYMFK